jgi:hypothetical protein
MDSFAHSIFSVNRRIWWQREVMSAPTDTKTGQHDEDSKMPTVDVLVAVIVYFDRMNRTIIHKEMKDSTVVQ